MKNSTAFWLGIVLLIDAMINYYMIFQNDCNLIDCSLLPVWMIITVFNILALLIFLKSVVIKLNNLLDSDE